MDIHWATVVIPTAISGISGLIGYFTFRHAQKQLKIERDRAAAENDKSDIIKAVDLAKYFATEIIPLSAAIQTVYQRRDAINNMTKKLKKKRSDGDIDFTYDEMVELFTEKELTDIAAAVDPRGMTCGEYCSSEMYFRKNLTEEHLRELIEQAGTKIKDLKDVHLRGTCTYGFTTTKDTLLNSLEYFALCFNTDIADKKTVYQSLHQMFLGAGAMMYYDIAQQNKDPKDYFYTNIRKLFNEWNREFNDQRKEESQLQNNLKSRRKGITRETNSYKK